MQVSDLDGTMCGETEFADSATRQFCTYWENNAALVGSVLVYNTGRSLGQFVALLQEKGGNLPLPDVLITAVGTKASPVSKPGSNRKLRRCSKLAVICRTVATWPARDYYSSSALASRVNFIAVNLLCIRQAALPGSLLGK